MIRTLIVDDDPFVRMSLQTILEAQDDVEVCALGADGDEAGELFERNEKAAIERYNHLVRLKAMYDGE